MPRYEQERLPPYVGLTGVAGCGKDTAASGLCASLGYERYAFADPIKDALAGMLGIDRGWLDDRVYKELPLEGLGVSPRRLAQTLGTEWGRDVVDQDWWLKLMAFRSKESPLVVIPDVRFDNEAEWIRERDGIVIRIHRNDAPGVEAHASERGVCLSLVDWHIVNDSGIGELKREVVRIVRSEGAWMRDRGLPHGETSRSAG